MALPLIPVIVGLVVAGGAGAALLAYRFKRGQLMSGIPAQVMIGATPFEKIGAVTHERIDARIFEKIRAEAKREQPPAAQVSEADGWEPVWVRKGNTATLHWGSCAWEYMQARMAAMGAEHGPGMEFFNTVFGKAMSWVISVVKAATLDISLCWRVELPAGHIDLQDGRSFWLTCRPPVDPAIEADPNTIQGWNPGSTRRGFRSKVASWPLGNTPPDSIGGAWIRPLGDLWNWSKWGKPVQVYQVVMPQNGILKSFPAMSKRDWRIALLFEGETPEEGLTRIYPDGVAAWLKDWRCEGQNYKLRMTPFVTRKSAMKKFAK
jgi:hypothetical protein